uniref:SXP/RAL-2 family protein Ani s 5-like cation-binding domain-containing protein n=1 Tax=Ascaris lumbricoides TaxID=6252 RepID=A0A0M3IIU4_ASCLU
MAHSNRSWFSSVIFTVFIFLHSNATPDPPPGPHPHGPPKDIPPGFAEVLPPEIVAKLRAIHKDDSLSWEQRREKFDKIMDTVPESIIQKLPPPPFMDKLPADVKAKLMAIHRQKGLSWRQRHQKVHEYIATLPENIKRLLPPRHHHRHAGENTRSA